MERQHDRERSIELHGLPPRVNLELIKLAANQTGQVENITLRACARGVKMNAVVTFEEIESVETLSDYCVRHMAIGKNLVRIKRLGDELIHWELQHACKIHGLPPGTTSTYLMRNVRDLNIKADFVEVPQYFARNSSQVGYRQEAFVYFKNEDDMTQGMAISIKMGRNELSKKDVTPATEQCTMEKGAYKKKVMEFHMAPPAKVRRGTTFADLLKGKGQTPKEQEVEKKEQNEQKEKEEKNKKNKEKENNEKEDKEAMNKGKGKAGKENKSNQGGQSSGTTQKKAEEQKSTQSAAQQTKTATTQAKTTVTRTTYQVGAQTDFSSTIADLLARQRTLESSMNDMQRTMKQLMETQNNL
ncbi:hypothetical protein BGZ65_011121, partial [Modicella reniformis]